MVEYDRGWNSWVHYAIVHDQFQIDHDAFWDALDSGASIDGMDPFWLALYFSVTTVSGPWHPTASIVSRSDWTGRTIDDGS